LCRLTNSPYNAAVRTIFVTIGLGLLLGACGSSETAMDMSVLDLADLSQNITSTCGQPGDTGNAKGIGKFCQTQADCSSTSGTICTHPFHPETYYCTLPCQTPGPDPTTCGDGTVCACDPAAPTSCGCIPVGCVGPMDG
jgi:hypothetical protein